VGTGQRDAGLVRAVGPWPLAASIVSMIVVAGIFLVPGSLAASVGIYAPLAFLACGIGIGSVAICFLAVCEWRSHRPQQDHSARLAIALLSVTAIYVVIQVVAQGILGASLARRGVALAGPPLKFRFLGTAVVVGIGSMTTMIALASRQEILGLATLIGLSILMYLLIQLRSAFARGGV
jgi:APA family basic amino acid/polyamine antiporter